MSLIDLAAFKDAPLVRSPFEHLVVPELLPPAAAAAVEADFPDIRDAGLWPLAELHYGPRFAELIAELRSLRLEDAFAEKFGLDLARRPLMITVRAYCDANDGRIHVDSESKVVTALLYLNRPWHDAGGRLRILNGSDDLDDFAAEVPPEAGLLVAFRRSDRSFHGHLPYSGPRRVVMFNWMADEFAARVEIARHRLSAKVKRARALVHPAALRR